jgi:pimeloyl-ACP methyl ester carboxylesterase
VTVPTQIVVGAQDIITVPAASKHMQRRISGSTLKQIDPAGHIGLLEQGKQYSHAIDDGSRDSFSDRIPGNRGHAA